MPQPGEAAHRSVRRSVRATAGRVPRPPRALVPRDRLLEALDRGSRLPLTMVVAPAGTGKTVLLADWATRQPTPVRWITATSDADILDQLFQPTPPRLDQAIGPTREPAGRPTAAALDQPAGESADVVTVGTTSRTAAEAAVVAAAVAAAERAVEAAVEPELVVIDDAHLLPRSSFERLSALLTDGARDVRLMIASRYDLPLPIVELELRSQGSTLRARDLQFTHDEAAALVRAHAAGATEADIELLQQKAAGWAAALVLGAHAIATSRDGPILTERPVLDLLLGDSFDTLDPRTKTVLLCTFGEPDVTSRLATVLSGDKDAGALLADLAAGGLLVTAYGDEPDPATTYRYHPLLVELLRRLVAMNSDNADRVVQAHRRAAVYFEHHGDPPQALKHALAAAEPEPVARILLAHGPAILMGGDVDLVTAAFDALPDDYVETHPRLLGVRGLLRRLTGDLTGAVMDAGRAGAALTADAPCPEESALEADVLLLRLWQSRFGWYDIADAIHATRALRERASHPNHDRAVIGLERLAWLLLELAEAEILVGDSDEALGHLDDVLVTARMARHPQLVAAGLADRAVLELTRAQIRSAERSAHSALDAAHEHGLPDEYVVRAQLVLGLAAFNQLDLDEARRWHDLAAGLDSNGIDPNGIDVTGADTADADLVVAALRETLRTVTVIEDGQLDDARLELASDPPSSGPMPSFMVRDLALLRLWVAGLVGDRGSVAEQISVLESSGSTADAALAKAVDSIVAGDVHRTLGAVDESLTQPGGHPALVASVKAFRTLLLLRIDDRAAAEKALADLVNDIAPQQLLHPLAAAGPDPAFMDLMTRYAGTPDAHPFASFALDKLTRYHARCRIPAGYVPAIPNSGPNSGPSTPDPNSGPSTPDTPSARSLDAVVNGATIRFTARETQVLDELALGSSYAEIAQTLYITENTVKTHLMSLYRKLGVDRRSAALRTARTIGLL
ncbi:LuxR C-terminal-related transcriptional regulator [Kribbella sp. NPDC048915]|uniref:LuxR C-terminal-related transcriptional regulator n=1 Tax=Kribbella sp. NPDC048915 TaxID=3155148 RepID=UPI0033C384F2